MVSTQLKNISQLGSFPQVGVKIKKYLKPPPRKHFCFFPFSLCDVNADACIVLSQVALFGGCIPIVYDVFMICSPGASKAFSSAKCHTRLSRLLLMCVWLLQQKQIKCACGPS